MIAARCRACPPNRTRRPSTQVSTLELFFDLVFVFTITQLTKTLADDTSPLGFAQVVIMLFVILWMYFGCSAWSSCASG
ncbi:low temperature requirement A protein (LtrA) [Lentzea atacamensis]|uniref:Low temperature requirement A protein (LtrA) n=1 Tax=Lentzea atacamensis TaxID=531938 RepID=A0A316HQ31_9PSEU|nr:low temperature requirement protein A [Lentzea atacamensis]PWK82269.1 low temperature requirement A protein (LtrA) [Lentzea atacamensis]